MKLNIIDIAFHRNGICGAPFHVVLFEDIGPDGSRKMAIVFEEPHHCSVLDVAKLAAGDVAFGSNSFRGDNYEPHLRQALDDPRKTARSPESNTAHGNAMPLLREALAWLATAAEDLDAAIDGVTDQFDSERVELHIACGNAREALAGTANQQPAGRPA